MTEVQRSRSERPTGERLVLSLQEYGGPKVTYVADASRAEREKSQLVLQVPASFVLTSAAYQEFMRKNRLHEVIEGLLKGVNVKDIDALKAPAAQIRQIISAALMPKSLHAQIQEAYQRLGGSRVVLWPVTTPYEMLHASGSRPQRPFLEAEGLEGVIQTIKTWWASLFGVEAIFYRELYGQKHSDTKTVLAIQQVGGT
jgi:phosphoenolpyruvate synthase/pyruvate phosphate dikinase